MTSETRTSWPQAKELQQAADAVRSVDPELAEWLDATANAMAWLAPYREGENGYRMWQAAVAVARKINEESRDSNEDAGENPLQ